MSGRLRIAHPSRKRLAEWLNDDAHTNLTEHIDHCDRCANTLEAIATTEVDIDTGYGEAIREAFVPPTDLATRVMERISERERADQEMSLLFGMMSITKDVAELMMPGQSSEETTPGTPELNDEHAPDHDPREGTS